jgi:hypothetical protein
MGVCSSDCLGGDSDLERLKRKQQEFRKTKTEHNQRELRNQQERTTNREVRLKKMSPARGKYTLPSQVLPWLYLGDIWNARDRKALVQLQIGTICNISRFENQFVSEGKIEYYTAPFDDEGTQLIYQCFEETIGVLERARLCHEQADATNQQCKNVLVHCEFGVSRSATVVLAYLLTKNRDWSVEQALQFLQGKRDVVEPNDGFVKQLRTFHQELQL